MTNKTKKSTATQNETPVNTVDNTTTTTETVATVENTNAEVSKRTPGRPVDTSSARQQRLLDMEMKKILNGGQLHRGRPTDPSSERQTRLQKMAENKANGGGKPGRPAMTAEQKQQAELLKKQKQAENEQRLHEAAVNALKEKGIVLPGVE